MRLLVSVEQAALQAKLRGYPARLATRLQTVMNRLTIQLQARVKEKLSGEVLHVRTGTLRRSINREVRIQGNLIEGIVGTNVGYGAAHEYGFHGQVSVRAHLRRVASRSQFSTVKGKKKLSAQGVAFVREHTMQMNIPERSFLRSALRELAPQFQADIERAATEALIS